MQGSLFLSSQSLGNRSHLGCTQRLQQQVASTSTRHAVKPLVVENRVVIRFQRYGRRKSPFYRIVAIDSKSRRQGIPIERLGYYNPLSKETNLNAPSIKKWLSVGAKPTEAAARILKRAMVIDPDMQDLA